MKDDVVLQDVQLLEEIELLGSLMVVASSADRQLTQREIDHVLGVGGSQTPTLEISG
ncbi:MAG TPA: hypothetical protein VH419_15130 [Nocardioidaceae bacterium]